MQRSLRFLVLLIAIAVGSVALPTLLQPNHDSASPYLTAIQKAAMPAASAVQCNGFQCVTVGGGGACFETFEAVWCQATAPPPDGAGCIGTFDCDV